MLRNQRGFSSNRRTWIVVADRSSARLFQQESGVRNWKPVREIDNPQGRLKSRDIESDRSGSSRGVGNTSYPMHGLANKGEATFHILRAFAKKVAGILQQGRVQEHFDRLVLVAEPRLLGEIRSCLDRPTRARVELTVPKVLTGLHDQALQNHLRENFGR